MSDTSDKLAARSALTFARLKSEIGAIIMTAADNAVNAVSDQLVKAKGEIDSVIAELESQAVSPAVLDRLRGVSQSLDDIKPDAAPSDGTDEPTPGPDQPAPEPADQP